MTPEQIAELERVAAERAGNLQPGTKSLTLESLHARLTAVENHPALNQVPIVETREYTGGTTAIGVASLPDQSPEQQEAQEHSNV